MSVGTSVLTSVVTDTAADFYFEIDDLVLVCRGPGDGGKPEGGETDSMFH